MWTRLPGLIIILAIGLIGGVSARNADWQSITVQGFTDGQTQVALEEEFDQALWIRDFAINVTTALRYGILRETSRGAVAGHKRWLFTDEEYQAHPGYDARLAHNIEQIITLQGELSARDITVVIALVPDKARIMSEYLARARPVAVEDRYDAILNSLQNAGLDVVDLRPTLVALNEEQLSYVRTDTHWTPEGARTVARALAPQIMAATDMRTSFETTPGEQQDHIGDLHNFVETGPFDFIVGPGSDHFIAYETTAFRGELGLFDDAPAVPGVLIGTSYSADVNWNFLGFLQTESQTDIINLAQEGMGPFEPMVAFLGDGTVDQLSPEVVIWEIPERYMTLAEEE